MKAGFRQSMAWLHTWSGLVVGWLLFAIFLTGTASYFRHEITAWMRPELHRTTAPDPNAAAIAAVARLTATAPDAANWFIDLPDERNPVTTIHWRDRTPGAKFQQATLAPATGAPLEARATLGGEFFYRFHFELHMPPIWGRWVVGAAAMVMLVAIVSGIITHRRIFKDFFTFRPGAKAAQRSWLDGHNALAVLALPFHIVITYSGLVTLMFLYMPWGVTSAYNGDQRAFFAETGVRAVARPLAGVAAPLTPVGPLLEEAGRRWNGGIAGVVSVANPGDSSASIDIVRRVGDRLSYNVERLRFDGPTGALMDDPDVERGSIQTHGSIYGLHIARFAGPWMRWLLFLSGMAGTGMVATGLVLWVVKARQRADKAGTRPGIGLALVERLNIATLAGLPLAMAAFLAVNRLLPAGLGQRPQAEVWCFFGVWALALLHTLLRPAPAAWREQLAAAALTLLAVPLLDLGTTGRLPALLAGTGDGTRLGFDLALLALSAAFAWLAWMVARRAPAPARHDAAATTAATVLKEQTTCR